MDINEYHVSTETYHRAFKECALLVGRIIIEHDGDFSDNDILVAKQLSFPGFTWSQNIQLFLSVIAGSRPNIGLYDECYAALTMP